MAVRPFSLRHKALLGLGVLAVVGVSMWMSGLGRARTVTVAPVQTAGQPATREETAPVAADTPTADAAVSDEVVTAPVTPATATPTVSVPVASPTDSTSSQSQLSSSVSTAKGADASPAKAHWVSFGFAAGKNAKRSIDTIVVHSSYNNIGGDEFDMTKVIEEYRQVGVSPHYLVARDGAVYQLVHEKDVAWHAGVSAMKDGRANVNDFSIGIEMIGTKTSGYTDAQYAALKKLLADIESRYTIKNVVGHSDIAPDRKTDPWVFDWKRI